MNSVDCSRKPAHRFAGGGLLPVLSAAALAALFLGGCTGGCSREEGDGAPKAQPSVGERMKDPEYVKQLDAIKEVQKGIMKRVTEAEAALAKARESGAAEAEIERLKAEIEDCAKAMDESRKKAQAAVRAKIMSVQAEQGNNAGKAK